MNPQDRPYHPSWKVAVLAIVPLLFATGIIGMFVATNPADRWVNAMLVIAGSSIGWAFGMMLSPDSAIEEKKFSNVWKGVSIFASGYLVSKLDPLINFLLTPESVERLAEPLAAYRLLAGLASIILTTILTYVVRVYVFNGSK